MDAEKNKYEKQHRGDTSAYETYFAGMDASMQQKIALTTAHFPPRGRVADMGSGSGRGTFDLARLYHGLELIGVDINPVSVEQSEQKFQSANLKYAVGDIAEKVFAESSLDGILDSSVLHHVTSFNNYDLQQIYKTLDNQVAQLKNGGALIIRDFVVPEGGQENVFLDLPTADGKTDGTIPELSTAALFEVFARDFRSSQNMTAGVPFKKHESPRQNFVRFELKMRAAAEFVLRKDYRNDWDAELIEEYTYFSQKDFERAFEERGLRIVVSMPLWNPWIVENRYVGKFYLASPDGKTRTFPPTNFLIVGEKVASDEGVVLREKEVEEINTPKFLRLKAYREKATNRIFELTERPNQTIDLLPWFDDGGQIFVLAKKDFPRPIVNACLDQKHLNHAHYSGYLTEPLSGTYDAEKNQRLISEILKERANLVESEILEISEPQFYFTSPGAVDERVESFLIKIAGWEKEPQRIENYTAFVSAGFVREMDALQVLRASHVGGMFDARLEINIYRLLRELKKSVGAWIGAQIKPSNQETPGNFAPAATAELSPPKTVAFEPCESPENRFLSVRKAKFTECRADDCAIAETEFEYVVPRELSKNTIAAIPFFKTAENVFVGIEFRDLPAVQSFTGSSRLVGVPAWRLSNSVSEKFELEDFLKKAFEREFAVEIKRVWELGGSYFPTPGVTPEVVYPMAAEIKAEEANKADLRFFALGDLLENMSKIEDAHLLILLNRLAHALG